MISTIVDTVAVPVVIAAGGAIIAAAIGWVGRALWIYKNRAQLEVSDCIHTDVGGLREVYVAVHNKGRTTARSCAGAMNIVPPRKLAKTLRVVKPGVIDDTALNPIREWVSGNRGAIQGTLALSGIGLPWSRIDHPVEINIHPSQIQRLIIGRFQLGEARFQIPTESGFERYLAEFEGLEFDFLVQITSENSASVIESGRVLWHREHRWIVGRDSVPWRLRGIPGVTRKPRSL